MRMYIVVSTLKGVVFLNYHTHIYTHTLPHYIYIPLLHISFVHKIIFPNVMSFKATSTVIFEINLSCSVTSSNDLCWRRTCILGEYALIIQIKLSKTVILSHLKLHNSLLFHKFLLIWFVKILMEPCWQPNS